MKWAVAWGNRHPAWVIELSICAILSLFVWAGSPVFAFAFWVVLHAVLLIGWGVMRLVDEAMEPPR